MPLTLTEDPRSEDLEEVVYWIKPGGRQWPVNEENIPLQEDGEPFELVNQVEGGIGILYDSPDTNGPEKLVFRLKMLLGKDHNEITQAMIKTRATTRGRRGRRQQVDVETKMDLALAVNLKLSKAIVEWEGLVDSEGNPAKITPENIDLLPAWIQNDLVDRVDRMSSLDEGLEGE